MKNKICILLSVFFTINLNAQIIRKSFSLTSENSSVLSGNVINDVAVSRNSVWIGTNYLCRTNDNGQSWQIFSEKDGIGRGSVSAIAVSGDTVWVATAFDTLTALGSLIAGGGLAWSADNGNTWTWISQPIDSADVTEYSPTTTEINNPTYDIAISDSLVWIASFAGGLRKSSDMGKTWKVVTVDGNPFSPTKYYTHRVFSCMYDGKSLWVGTAGGVHKSDDGGKTWVTFNHQNQGKGISGNFVVALALQKTDRGPVVWAATVEAVDQDEYRAVSFTKDGGLTWHVCLQGEFAHNFAFYGNDVYVVTNSGLFKSSDYGEHWAVFPDITDFETGEGLFTEEFYSIDISNAGGIWLGTNDGLGYSFDNGVTWKVFRAFKSTSFDSEPETYAYPNPFSPFRHNRINGEGHVRFQYHITTPSYITVKVYDFSMNLVKVVAQDKYRVAEGDFSETWNGKNEVGDVVANGVYFYSVDIQGKGTFWGKVMVVD
ncbi:hypothetical protein DRQ07_00805 [candidate division KSB1 bacterium]|nr:MAG: hypothetical protein DRQ07_00805 [candidate division KSB1 bacterium]